MAADWAASNHADDTIIEYGLGNLTRQQRVVGWQVLTHKSSNLGSERRVCCRWRSH